jgi:hypothetical protein
MAIRALQDLTLSNRLLNKRILLRVGSPEQSPAFPLYRSHKNGIASGNVQPVNDDPAFQDEFLFIPLASRERVFFQPLQGRFDDPACFYGEAIDLIR